MGVGARAALLAQHADLGGHFVSFPDGFVFFQPRADQYDDFGQYLRRHRDAAGAFDDWDGADEFRPSVLHWRGRLHSRSVEYLLRLGAFAYPAICHSDVHCRRSHLQSACPDGAGAVLCAAHPSSAVGFP